MLKVAIVATNNDHSYSGGRYHALIMAYALALAGDEVHFITNKRPVFVGDLEPICPDRVRFVLTNDFAENMPSGRFNLVIVVPTGIFQPDYYEAALRFARSARARVALLNFESADWFNSCAPVPRDPRIWDYWRRTVLDGGLVLSSTMESQRHAERFYRSPQALRFEVVSPPINSHVADQIKETPKDGGVIAFVRAADIHKGGGDLLSLDPMLFQDRTLRVVAGGPLEGSFEQALTERIGNVPGASLEVHVGVSDAEKFQLLARSQALLFPSRFEGFGYPPVEAAYAGTEVVCYDLPVLVETVGGIAHMAPVGNVEALGARLAEALQKPARRDVLRGRVADRVSLKEASTRFHDVLARTIDVVPALHDTGRRVAWGPWPDGTPPGTASPAAWTPPYLASSIKLVTGDFAVDFKLEADRPIQRLECRTPDSEVRDKLLRLVAFEGGLFQTTANVIVPGSLAGKRLSFEAFGEDAAPLLRFEVSIFAAPAVASTPLDIVLLSDGSQSAEFAGEFTGQESANIDEIAVSIDGERWHLAQVVNGRFAMRGFSESPQLAGPTLLAFRKGATVRVLNGYPLQEGNRRVGQVLGANTYSVAHVTNEQWMNGTGRQPIGSNLGVIALNRSHETKMPSVGSVVRLADGQIRIVESVKVVDTFPTLMFSRGVSPTLHGHPRTLEVLRAGTRNAELMLLNEGNWKAGIWSVPGSLTNRAVAFTDKSPMAFEGDVVRFASGTERFVKAVYKDRGKQVVWLSAPVQRADTAKPAVVLRAESVSAPPVFKLVDRNGSGWNSGVMTQGTYAGREVCADVEFATAQQLRRENIVFERGGARRVIDVEQQSDGYVTLRLDATVDAEADGYPNTVRMMSEAERTRGLSSTLKFKSTMRARETDNPRKMFEEVFRRLPPPGDPKRPRVLFATLVPPLPADQGNRVVTRNFILHLLRRGFDVDVLLVGSAAAELYWQEFGDRVRVFATPFPDWGSDPSIKVRRDIVESLRKTNFAESETTVLDALIDQAMVHHPYLIVPDAAIELAKTLFGSCTYQSIVCNYTHMVRIADELQALGPLPPTVVVTHDALSRLPRSFDGVPMDLMYRYCTPELERSVLDAVNGATVLAISASEQSYFKSLGVKNSVLLCEFDALYECAPFHTSEAAFEAKTLIFHASANAMNVASLQWFLDKCWPDVLARVPEAKLLVAGKVCKAIEGDYPSLIKLNELSRLDLLRRLGTSAIAINPTVAGTGLKIKTVEAASLGLPSVCLPQAVEGLERDVSRFCILAHTPEAFSDACVRLLGNREAWTSLRESTLNFAAERFSPDAIYRQVDAQLKWSEGVESRFKLARIVPPDTPASHAEPVTADAATAERSATDLRGIAEHLLSLEQNELSAQVLDLYANKFGGNAKDYYSNALSSLARGCPAYAIEQALVSIETGGSVFAACDVVVSALKAMNREADAKEVANALHLVAPLSPHLAGYPTLWLTDTAYPEAVYPLPVNRSIPPRFLVPVGERFGFGWGRMETWGVWTEASYSRARFVPNQRVSGPLELDLTLHAPPGGFDPEQTILIYANGSFCGDYRIQRDAGRVSFTAKIPHDGSDDGDRKVILEIFVVDPEPYRKPDGSVTDLRRLGVALSSVGLRTAAVEADAELVLADVG